jgi:NAD(P)-dependent dehydrogenase (short-subunit alcohol dehydrogenase family)
MSGVTNPDAPTFPSSEHLARIDADLSDRVAVVTGATAGIGHEAAYGLARLGARVVLVGRSGAKAAAAREALAVRGVDPVQLELGVADLSRLTQVAALAEDLTARFGRIDVLVNNAGCYPSGRHVTPEGFEESWATNVLAYEALTTRLLGPLTAAGGRIVYVASTMAGGLAVDDLLWERRRFRGVKAYAQSKQADRMLAWAWARRLAGTGVTINVAHPDGTATNIAGRQRGLYGVLARLAFRTQRSPAESADVVVWLAAAPELAGVSAGFFHNRTPIECRYRDDEPASEALWTLCQEQIAGTRTP